MFFFRPIYLIVILLVLLFGNQIFRDEHRITNLEVGVFTLSMTNMVKENQVLKEAKEDTENKMELLTVKVNIYCI